MRVAAVAIVLAVVTPAWAQPADPPARVGRVARIAGTVSYRFGGDETWRPAVLNLPVTNATALWTEPGAEADIDIASDRITLDTSSEFDVSRLDDARLDAIEPQGTAYLHLLTLAQGETFDVQTPRGMVRVVTARPIRDRGRRHGASDHRDRDRWTCRRDRASRGRDGRAEPDRHDRG